MESRVAVNVHASDKFRCHQVLYRGTILRWMHDLGIGDKISIIPKAKFPGWKNVLQEASIEIHTSCLQQIFELILVHMHYYWLLHLSLPS